jgi:ATP-dependent Clp protease adaptor protein ClpS
MMFQGTEMTQAETKTKTRTKTNLDAKEPPMFRVIYLNDDETPMQFVIESLIEHFDYTIDSAQDITVTIHEQGSATVAVLPYELAEQKGVEITVQARSEGYPLQIKLESQA